MFFLGSGMIVTGRIQVCFTFCDAGTGIKWAFPYQQITWGNSYGQEGYLSCHSNLLALSTPKTIDRGHCPIQNEKLLFFWWVRMIHFPILCSCYDWGTSSAVLSFFIGLKRGSVFLVFFIISIMSSIVKLCCIFCWKGVIKEIKFIFGSFGMLENQS